MSKKFRRVRTFARTAAKSLEKKLIDNAKHLKEDPYQILPDYSDKYSEKYFNKIKKALDKVSRFKDDEKKLEKLANKKGLEGALAGTLILAQSEKAPYLAVSKYSIGTVSYAQRGRADKEKLIAVQHFDDPVLRLLGFKDIALKRKLHIYSWDEGFFSSGLEPNPPEKFVKFIIKKVGLNFSDKVVSTSDITPEVARNKKIVNKNYLRIFWKSADVVIAISEEGAKSTKNTIFNISKYLLVPNLSDYFTIEVIGQVVKKIDTGFETENINEYLCGEITDYEFITKNMKQREKTLREGDEKILILDGVSYGIDAEGFIQALKPNKFEREGLRLILEKINEPVILNNVTPNKVLERYWKDFGFDAINSMIGEEELAKKFFELQDTPSDILKLVFDFKERQQILSQLPKYKSLPSLSKFVDNVVRTYKTFGEKEALSEIKKRPDNPKAKSIAYAFLLNFGKAKDVKWQYSNVEIEYGEFLKDNTKKLLESDSKKYHQVFKELLISSGSSENIDEYKI